jgi:cyclophilin family peptidyl-prolyl cis-trans isomerase
MRKTLLTSLFVIASLASSGSAFAQAPAKPRVELKTSLGTVVVELDRAAAPKTVENFLEYVKAGFYDGTVFHRVIKNFMAQGGGFDQELKQKATRPPVVNEGEQAEKTGLKNDRGTIAMARTADPHSATAQFFINFKDNAFLNHSAAQAQIPPVCKVPNPVAGCARYGWGYTAFGRVISGMDVVDKMADIPTGSGGPFPSDVPKTPIVLEKATIISQ